MKAFDFQGYLTLLRELKTTLSQLTQIEREKTQAVRDDDLDGLNRCMKQEQAFSMSLRGFEQKQQAVRAALSLESVPLRDLAAHAPAPLQAETARLSEALRSQYQLFHAAFEVAQNTLECNLHQIEKVLGDLGEAPRDVIGYEDSGPSLPQNLRTDFHA